MFRQFQAGLHEVDGNQSIQGTMNQTLKDELAHEATSDYSDTVSRYDLAVIDPRDRAGDGLHNPVSIGEV